MKITRKTAPPGVGAAVLWTQQVAAAFPIGKVCFDLSVKGGRVVVMADMRQFVHHHLFDGVGRIGH